MGILVGFTARSFVGDYTQRLLVPSVSKPAMPMIARGAPAEPAKPIVYPSAEKTLARLKKQYDEAVVVVLADESYDDAHKLIRVSVLEVWKGPVDLAGKTMDSRLEAPLSYGHPEHSERVLRFMPMTPHLDTAGSVFFTGDELRMNPTLTVSSIKAALVEARKERG
ncbi:MAG TPA: hypothetical protein VHD61_03280 [Lacunisphaera sp.]|nr:hypothetical protein [Lacunisphaera sp.]